MDNLNLNSAFFDLNQKTLDTETSRSIGSDLTFAGFQDQPGSRAVIQDMMKLVERCVDHFYKQEGFEVDSVWGVCEENVELIEKRLKEVYPLSYQEYISVFSYMAMTVNIAEVFTRRLSDMCISEKSFWQKIIRKEVTKTEVYTRLKSKSDFFKVYSLVIRALYLRYQNLPVRAWNDINDKLIYIRKSELALRDSNPEFINTENNRITPQGLMFLKDDFQNEFGDGYEGIVDDFPTLAETWIRGVVTAKHSLKYTDRKRFETIIKALIKRHEEVAQTVLDLYDLDNNYGSVNI